MPSKSNISAKQRSLQWSSIMVVAGMGMLWDYTACTAPKPAPDVTAATRMIGAKQYDQAIDVLTDQAH
jgi:hypothetical protein